MLEKKMHSLQSLESTVQHRSAEQAACQRGWSLGAAVLRSGRERTMGQGWPTHGNRLRQG